MCTSVYVVHLMYMLEVIENLSKRWPRSQDKTDILLKESADRKELNAMVDNKTNEIKAKNQEKAAEMKGSKDAKKVKGILQKGPGVARE